MSLLFLQIVVCILPDTLMCGAVAASWLAVLAVCKGFALKFLMLICPLVPLVVPELLTQLIKRWLFLQPARAFQNQLVHLVAVDHRHWMSVWTALLIPIPPSQPSLKGSEENSITTQ